MSIVKEFKEFAMKGNLVEMAVAFFMGAAFGKVVSGFIDGMVMPIVGKITTGVDFKSMKYILSEEQIDETGKIIVTESSIKYGEFITIFIDFLLVSFFMFMVIKAMNKAKKNNDMLPSEPRPLTEDQKLLSEIRDLLKK